MADEETAPEGGEDGGNIVVVDPDAGSRNDAEDLEDELECQVVAMDSMDFDTEASEEVLEAGAFIVAWDLGIRSGADLLEEIRRHPRLGTRPVVVAMKAPTPAMVRWAIALGADGVCALPYDPEEVAARLEAARAAAA